MVWKSQTMTKELSSPNSCIALIRWTEFSAWVPASWTSYYTNFMLQILSSQSSAFWAMVVIQIGFGIRLTYVQLVKLPELRIGFSSSILIPPLESQNLNAGNQCKLAEIQNFLSWKWCSVCVLDWLHDWLLCVKFYDTWILAMFLANCTQGKAALNSWR